MSLTLVFLAINASLDGTSKMLIVTWLPSWKAGIWVVFPAPANACPATRGTTRNAVTRMNPILALTPIPRIRSPPLFLMDQTRGRRRSIGHHLLMTRRSSDPHQQYGERGGTVCAAGTWRHEGRGRVHGRGQCDGRPRDRGSRLG